MRSRVPVGCVVLAGAVATLLVPDLRACLRLAAISRGLREALHDPNTPVPNAE